MPRCSVRCLKQRDDILAGHRAVDDLCVFDLREYRRDDLANLGAWHTGVLERMRDAETRIQSAEDRKPCCRLAVAAMSDLFGAGGGQRERQMLEQQRDSLGGECVAYDLMANRVGAFDCVVERAHPGRRP